MVATYISHSASQSWKTCPELHYLKHIARIMPNHRGASLAFGIAIDNALSYLLSEMKEDRKHLAIPNFKIMFLEKWDESYDSLSLMYRRADFDQNVIQDTEDRDQIAQWEDELGVLSDDALKAEKQKEHRQISPKEQKMFNRLCWLSLRNKGQLMLDAFLLQILPKIKRVIAVQYKLEGAVDKKVIVGGYIDLICEYEGYSKPVVFDIKTSSSFYDDNRVLFSEQLLLYLAAVGKELDTNLTGFLVLLKYMKLKEVCVKCGNIKDSRHKTCNQIQNGVRCNGEWKKIPEGQTQVQVEKIEQSRLDDFMDSFSNLALLMSQGKRVKNFNSCFNYGLCDYFHLCHYADRSKYSFPEDKKNKKD